MLLARGRSSVVAASGGVSAAVAAAALGRANRVALVCSRSRSANGGGLVQSQHLHRHAATLHTRALLCSAATVGARVGVPTSRATSALGVFLDGRDASQQLQHHAHRAPITQRTNIVLAGSGKTSIGRVLSRLLKMPLIDVDDDLLEPHWGTTVANKLKALGDDQFVAAEGEALETLNVANTIVSLSGSNPLHSRSLEHVAKNGIVVYLDIDPAEILARCERMKVDRIVGQATTSLASILAHRRSIYENCYDLRCIVAPGESVDSLAERIRSMVERARQPTPFVSTRGFHEPLQFLDVVHKGLSPDRGLFVPATLKGLGFSKGELVRLQALPYEELALRVMERFPLGDRLHPSELRRILSDSYATFDHEAVLPLAPLSLKAPTAQSAAGFFHPRLHLMETFHGPTASFKDLSLQLLPKLMRVATDKARDRSSENGQGERIGLLVATSGDTGTAALDGFSREAGVPVVVLYPSHGVSIVQRAQMQTTGGDVLVLGVDSDFDFCQRLVKDVFNDRALNQEFRSIVPRLTLSSANSMNFGRFLPQVVFSVSSYLQLVSRDEVALGSAAHLVVPTGNFGNILGAVYAKLVLGLPLGRIVCASNTNNILFDFIRTGTYDLRKRSFTQTVSPSIDILVSSNLERFLHLLAGEEREEVRALFHQLETEGHFTVSPTLRARMQEVVEAGWTTEEQCLDTIRQTFERTGQLIGQAAVRKRMHPHTAVGVHVANSLLASDSTTPVIVSSTAHFAKFPHAMCHALGHNVPSKDEASLPRMMRHLQAAAPAVVPGAMHSQLALLADRPALHDDHCPADRAIVIDRIKRFLKEFAARNP